MPPRKFSRYTFTTGIKDSADRLFLTDRVRFGFRELDDTREYIVKEGDTLFLLAGRFYRGLSERAAGFWWVIADFQPDPVHDPTLKLEPGLRMFIPSKRTILEEIFAESRRLEM